MEQNSRENTCQTLQWLWKILVALKDQLKYGIDYWCRIKAIKVLAK